MNSYELSRKWFDFCFENPDLIKPAHSAIYFFAIEHCNRLGWKEKFGFPSQMVMEAIGIKNWRTYSKALNEVVGFGFITMIETSKNQYSANIIKINATVKNTKAPTKALDKALSKHLQKQGTKQGRSTVSINKQENKEQGTKNKEQVKEVLDYLNKKLNKKFRTAKGLLKRFDENYTVDDCKTVIDKKTDEWKGTDMEQYLVPDTLFSGKFDKYLNQTIIKPQVKGQKETVSEGGVKRINGMITEVDYSQYKQDNEQSDLPIPF